jgi:glycerol-1-phosphate dehydrogenase [NAD(P)+]
MAIQLKTDLPSFFEIGEYNTVHLLKLLHMHHLEFKHVLLLGDHKTFLIGGGPISKNLEDGHIKVTRFVVSNSDESNVSHVEKIIRQKKPDLVLGFGGGKVLDVAKLAAGNKNTTFISIPTTLSNDGISSPVAVIKDKKNIPVSHITKAPYGIIVDISIVKKAPEKHIKAGIGDLVSNLSAVFDARLAHEKGRETITSMALTVSEAGPLSLLDFKKPSIHNNDFLLCLAQGLTKSGIAMCITGSSRPASGSEHKISHAIDHLHSPRDTLHGEQTGIAAIFTMALQENEYLDRVIKFYKDVTFPHTLSHLSLTVEQFIQVVHAAGNIRPQRYTILEDMEITDKKIREIIKKTGL